VAQAIARQAQLLDFDVTILEDRPEFSTPERFGGARVLGGHIPDTLATLEYGWNSYIVIATRGHKLDADCLLSAVRTDARYVGLLGSRRKAALVSAMLKEEGVPESRIDAIRTPVGLDLGGRTPAEIALSVLAEITQARYAGKKR
jgi:xanthine dehydrogenase accessory factor